MEQIKNIIIIILSAVLLKCCLKKNQVVTETNYQYIKGSTDTVYVTKTVIQKDIKPSKVVVIRDTINDSVYVSYNQVTTEYKDSLIDMEITQIVQGTLISSDIKYTANIPTYHRVDTVKITNTIQPKGFYIGTQFGIRDITPNVSYVWSSYKADLGYNIFNHSPMIGVSVKF